VIVFLGGPIQYAISGRGFDGDLRQLISSLYDVLTGAGVEVLSAHVEERFGEIDLSEEALYVTKRDFEWMQRCDAYLCVLPPGEGGRPYRSDGTCIELGWASAMAKPVIMIWEPCLVHSHLIAGLSAIGNVRYMPIDEVKTDPSSVLSALLRSAVAA
jgi:nucleoside 2-deoxyribosyltransferase